MNKLCVLVAVAAAHQAAGLTCPKVEVHSKRGNPECPSGMVLVPDYVLTSCLTEICDFAYAKSPRGASSDWVMVVAAGDEGKSKLVLQLNDCELATGLRYPSKHVLCMKQEDVPQLPPVPKCGDLGFSKAETCGSGQKLAPIQKPEFSHCRELLCDQMKNNKEQVVITADKFKFYRNTDFPYRGACLFGRPSDDVAGPDVSPSYACLDEGSSGLSTGAIVGIVLGAVCGVVVGVVAYCFVTRRAPEGPVDTELMNYQKAQADAVPEQPKTTPPYGQRGSL